LGHAPEQRREGAAGLMLLVLYLRALSSPMVQTGSANDPAETALFLLLSDACCHRISRTCGRSGSAVCVTPRLLMLLRCGAALFM